MTLTWTVRAHSEIGLVRKNNQDSGFVGHHLLLVADGMGGAAAGDLASAVAVEEIKGIDDEAGRSADGGNEARLTLLTNAIHAANSRIADLISDDPQLEGMGTTVTGGLLITDRLSLAHIGDSRAYLLRDGRLERLTHDHSWVQSLVDDGKISEAEAAVHPHRSLLLKVLNGQPANEPDTTTVELRAGDRLLFCSDGLCGFVDDADIEADLRSGPLDEAMESLVEAAHAAGGLDNITIILAEAADDTPVPVAPVEETVAAGPADPADPATAENPAVPSDRSPDLEVPLVLGAAAERDIPSNDTMIRSRADLTGAEAAATTASGSADDEDRYAPQAPHRWRFVRPLVGLLVAVLVIGAALGAGFAWSRTQYYVGADADQVAIFQGLSDDIPGVPLSRVYEVQPIAVTSLPLLYQDMVRGGIDVADLSTARITVDQLREAAQRCESERKASAGPSGKPTAKPTGKASATASSTASSKPTPGASATAPEVTASTAVTGSPSPSASASPSGSLPGGNQAC